MVLVQGIILTVVFAFTGVIAAHGIRWVATRLHGVGRIAVYIGLTLAFWMTVTVVTEGSHTAAPTTMAFCLMALWWLSKTVSIVPSEGAPEGVGQNASLENAMPEFGKVAATEPRLPSHFNGPILIGASIVLAAAIGAVAYWSNYDAERRASEAAIVRACGDSARFGGNFAEPEQIRDCRQQMLLHSGPAE